MAMVSRERDPDLGKLRKLFASKTNTTQRELQEHWIRAFTRTAKR
jgi:hypothetical protein